MVWISLIDFPWSLAEKPDKHKVPIKGQVGFTIPCLFIRTTWPHISSGATSVAELPAFILLPTNEAHSERVKLSSVLDWNCAVLPPTPSHPPLRKDFLWGDAQRRFEQPCQLALTFNLRMRRSCAVGKGKSGLSEWKTCFTAQVVSLWHLVLT